MSQTSCADCFLQETERRGCIITSNQTIRTSAQLSHISGKKDGMLHFNIPGLRIDQCVSPKEQTGAELGQAQLKLELDLTLTLYI